MLALRLWVFLSIYATIHGYDLYLTDTCDADNIIKLIRDSCNADRRRSLARAGPLLIAAMRPKGPPIVSISELLGVPASWTVEEDAMQGLSSLKVRQNNEKFEKMRDYCCQHHCDVETFRGIC